MSAIAVVLQLDGDRLEPAALRRVVMAMDDCGPDGSGEWLDGCAGLGQQSLALTLEEVGETQPIVIGDLVGVFDGRLDNRDELIDELFEASPTGRVPTDAELAVRSFDRWRHDCPKHLLGDFGLAVWDGHREELFCARDHIGIRPLYYAVHGRVLVLATDVRGVLAHPSLPREPNARHVAEILSDDVTNRTDTLYEGLFRLPPAHALSARDGTVTTTRYWDADLMRELTYPDDDDYVDHFLSVFGEAVHCRMRSNAPVTTALSGGLDSSLISGVAMERRSSEQGFASSVDATSLVFPGESCDESVWIRAVADAIGIEVREVPWAPLTWDQLLNEATRTMYLPPAPNMAVDRFVWAGIRRTVVMSGTGGDQWMVGHYGYFKDLLARRDFVKLGRSAFQGGSSMMAQAAQEVVEYRANAWTRRLRRQVAEAPASSLVGPALQVAAQAVQAAAEEVLALPRPLGVDRSKHQRYKTLHYPWEPYVFELAVQAVGGGNLLCVEPFYDRRVVEFALAVPDSQRWRGRDYRWLQRRALRRVGLGTTADRHTKPEFSPTSRNEIRNVLDSGLPTRLKVDQYGWIAKDAFVAGTNPSSASLDRTTVTSREQWLVAALEAWVRAAWG